MSSDTIPAKIYDLIDETQAKLVASLVLQGITQEDIATQLKITKYAVSKIAKSDEFKEALADVSERAINVSISKWKSRMEELEPLAYDAIKKALKRGDLKAVEIFVKTLGIDKQVATQAGGNIQVILPNLTPTKDVIND